MVYKRKSLLWKVDWLPTITSNAIILNNGILNWNRVIISKPFENSERTIYDHNHRISSESILKLFFDRHEFKIGPKQFAL